MAWLERWLQTEWPHLKVYLTSVTEHWATAAVAGPEEPRGAVEAVCADIDFSRRGLSVHVVPRGHGRRRSGARLPHQLLRRARLRGQRAAPTRPRHVWEALMQAGDDIRHHAVRHRDHARAARREGLHHRRPGHRRLGHARSISAWTGSSPREARTSSAGARSAASRHGAPDRKQLVGLLTEDPTEVLPEGAQLVAERQGAAVPMLGHVTSSYFSAKLAARSRWRW